MSVDCMNLCSSILKLCFGDVVEVVGTALGEARSRSLANLIKVTKLTRSEVTGALAVLMKFQLVSFSTLGTNLYVAEYELQRDDVLNILRYPQYVCAAQKYYGHIGSSIIDELVQSGYDTATTIILKCLGNAEPNDTIEMFRSTFLAMISDHYLIKLPSLVPNTDPSPNLVPKFNTDPLDFFTPPDISNTLIAQMQVGKISLDQAPDEGTYWQLNYKRFHQDFRDDIMIGAVERKMGTSAAECFQYILKQMYERTDPWQKQSSNPFTFVEVKQLVEKKSNNLDLIKHLDQYVKLIAKDSLGFLRKIGDMGGGQYIVSMENAFEELAMICVENIITERFGSKASRIFRIIRMKQYIEQEDLQKEAMIPAKEAKLLSYNLFQAQFIQVKTVRKAGGGGTGPAKAFYLFQLKHKRIAQMLLDTCYKALTNDIIRAELEKNENVRLIEKSQKMETIVESMKDHGDPDDYIAEIMETLTPPEQEMLTKVTTRIDRLSRAEAALDKNIFLLQMYLYHKSNTPLVITTTD